MRDDNFNLNSMEAVDKVLSGLTIIDDKGYTYRYPTKEEIKYFCEANEIIRCRKCDTTAIKINELHHYEDFMGEEVNFRVLDESELKYLADKF